MARANNNNGMQTQSGENVWRQETNPLTGSQMKSGRVNENAQPLSADNDKFLNYL